jgi:hypothetical protein
MTVTPDDHEQDAVTLLRGAAYSALRLLSCRVQQQRLVLAGRVPTFYLKQQAQSLLISRLGHKLQVENRVTVAGCAAGPGWG